MAPRSKATTVVTVKSRAGRVAAPPKQPVSISVKRTTSSARGATSSRPTERNDYFASLLDPIGVTGVGIPDFDTYPSLKVQTSHRARVTTDASGNFTLCVKPALRNGVISPGIDGVTGNYHMVAAVAAAAAIQAPVGSSLATVGQILNTTDQAFFQANYESIRPVSFAIKTENISPALDMSGVLMITQIPAEAQPFPASFSTLIASGIESVAPLGVPTFTSPDDIMGARGQLESATREAIISWCPEGPESYMYQQAETLENGCVGWRSMPLTLAASASVAPNADYLYNLPRVYRQVLDIGAPNAAGATVVNMGYDFDELTTVQTPSIVLRWEGCPASTPIAEIEYVCNWECIPKVATTSILPVTASPANPDELAQASNIMPMLPRASYPGTPSMPANAALALAKRSTTHLYDKTISRKSAIEGRSVWTDVRQGAGALLKSAAPFLLKVPLAGPLLSGGAALIGSLLSR